MSDIERSSFIYSPEPSTDGPTPPPDIIPNPNYWGIGNPDGSMNVTIQAGGEEIPIPEVPERFQNTVFKQDGNGEWIISKWTNPRISPEDITEFCGLIGCGEISQDTAPIIVPINTPTATPTATPSAIPTSVPEQIDVPKNPAAEINFGIPLALAGTAFTVWAGFKIKDWLEGRSEEKEVNDRLAKAFSQSQKDDRNAEKRIANENSDPNLFTEKTGIPTKAEATDALVDEITLEQRLDDTRKVAQIEYAETKLPPRNPRPRGKRPSFGGNSTNPIVQWLWDNWFLQNDPMALWKEQRKK